MPIPRLLHPVPVTFELLERSETFFDPRAREPVRQAVRSGALPNTGSSVTVKGQVSFYFAGAKLDYPEWQKAGVLERSTGYVALRFVDLLNAGLVEKDDEGAYTNFRVKRGDRITRLGKRTVNFYVTGFKDFAFYPGPGQTMIQVNFDDRHPSSQEADL